MDNKLPSLIDKHVGRRLRWRRRELKLSQEALAEKLGLTFQQVQKYERGANRISAGRLFEMARVLETNIPYFFEGAEAVNKALQKSLAEDSEEFNAFPGLIDGEVVELVIAYQSIGDAQLRRSILTMVRNQAAVFAERSAAKTRKDKPAKSGKPSSRR